MPPYLVYATAAVIVLLILSQVFRRSFDPFAPHWLFLLGFAQVYVVQALSYREYGLRVRGAELVHAADLRAFWALLWFLAVYYLGPSRWLAGRLPRPPLGWSAPAVGLISPVLILWGLFCAGMALNVEPNAMTGGLTLLHAFPFVMLLGGILLLITGRNADQPRPAFTITGVVITAAYVLIWMFNAKRSHALFGVLTGVCAYYIPRYRRPSKPVLAATGLAGILAVSLAIGWRGNAQYERSFAGFFTFVGDFDPANALVNLNLATRNDIDPHARAPESHETEEWGGYLLMMDTVPQKSDYDYGASYLRLVSTFIPRIFWPDKPFFGREAWVNAWIAGSEYPRDKTFTGPAISILGATQLNGGAWATAIVLGAIAILLRTAYEFFRLYPDAPWVQAWWTVTYFNAWLMTVNDDPFVWFYYNYGFTTLFPMAGLWIYLKFTDTGPTQPHGLPVGSWAGPLVPQAGGVALDHR